MRNTRRKVIKAAAALGAAGSMLGVVRQLAIAQPKRVLKFNIVANTLGVHIPYMGALNEMLPNLGYGQPQIDRISRLETITQSILTGSAEVGSGDAISVLRAVQAGADLKIIGNCFMNTDLVFVANSETVKTDRDLEKSSVTVAVNSIGDFTHVILAKPLEKRGIDIKKVNVISMGGSGTRLRALVAGKIDAVPIHFDQAQELVATGKFRILVEPWKEFDNFLGEVWIASNSWISNPQNRRAGIDLLKAVMLSFRKADQDAGWYTSAYRQYGTDGSMQKDSDSKIEEIRITLAQTVKAWPPDMRHRIEIYRELLPIYQEAGAITGSINLENVVDVTLVAQALKELDHA
jgi:NitT/TauT family transport system substrate-binding protein